MKNDKQPQTLTSLLQQMPWQFRQATKEAAGAEKLSVLVSESLQEPLLSHVSVGGFHNGILTLHVDIPTWVMPLSMQRMALMQKLRRNGFPQLTSIKCEVKPLRAQQRQEQQRLVKEQQKPNPRRITNRTACDLTELASHVDEPLKSKLLALSRLRK